MNKKIRIFFIISIYSINLFALENTTVVGNLMWQDNKDVKKVYGDWSYNREYCNNFTGNGYKDWRLPTLNELKLIIDKSMKPAMKREFKHTIDTWHWSSDIVNSTDAWFVDFYSGDIGYGNKSNKFFVRCVRIKL